MQQINPENLDLVVARFDIDSQGWEFGKNSKIFNRNQQTFAQLQKS